MSTVNNGEVLWPRTDKMPFLNITRGVLEVDCEDTPFQWSLPATLASARLLGQMLRASGFSHWVFSSSLHFPLVHGGEDIDFTNEIQEGYDNYSFGS